MSIRIEDNCVGCQDGTCVGSGCIYRNMRVCYCDNCDSYADYSIDGDDLCASCAEILLNDIYTKLSLEEKLDMLEEQGIVEVERLNE